MRWPVARRLSPLSTLPNFNLNMDGIFSGSLRAIWRTRRWYENMFSGSGLGAGESRLDRSKLYTGCGAQVAAIHELDSDFGSGQASQVPSQLVLLGRAVGWRLDDLHGQGLKALLDDPAGAHPGHLLKGQE